MNPPKRVLIIGISGVGKSTLARKLSQRWQLPLFYIDQLWWKPHWQPAEEAAVASKLAEILKQERWVLEGYLEPLGAQRIEQADLVLYLDYSGWQAFFGGIKRLLSFRKRVEMPEGCVDQLDFSYLKTMLLRLERPEIEATIKPFESKVVRLKSRRALKKFLATH